MVRQWLSPLRGAVERGRQQREKELHRMGYDKPVERGM